jgi:uncharacterized protein YjiS (DUF1127 family)
MFQSQSAAAGTRTRRNDDAPSLFALRRAKEELGLWLRRLQWRHELSRLDADQLRDVGLDEQAIRREVEKPFWQE